MRDTRLAIYLLSAEINSILMNENLFNEYKRYIVIDKKDIERVLKGEDVHQIAKEVVDRVKQLKQKPYFMSEARK